MDEKELIEMMEILVENAKQMQNAVEKVSKSANSTCRSADSLRNTLREGMPYNCILQNSKNKNDLRRFIGEAVAEHLDWEVNRVNAVLAATKRACKVIVVAVAIIAALAVLTICFGAAVATGSLHDGFWQICSGIGVLVLIAVVVATLVSMG